MTEREWKPGDVAMVRFADSRREFRAMRDVDGKGWGVVDHDGSLQVQDARPLVVIDIEDREQITHLQILLSRWGYDFTETPRFFKADEKDGSCLKSALREFADPKPPKPEEPTGLGAVVLDARGHQFVRMHDGWWRGQESCTVNWAAMHPVEVLSEGVASDD